MTESNLHNLVIVGSARVGAPSALHLFDLHPATGELAFRSSTEEFGSLLYVTTDPSKRHLFVADALTTADSRKLGRIHSFHISSTGPRLKWIDSESSLGAVPCYLAASFDGRFLLVANYGDGKVAVLTLSAGGKFGNAIEVRAGSANPGPSGSRAHSFTLDHPNRFAIAVDLGLDNIISYGFDPDSGKLSSASSWKCPAGSGPRHLIFHPCGKHAYLISEYANTVTAFAYNRTSGELRPLQVKSSLPDTFTGKNFAADLRIHPKGHTVYGSNRGHDSIVTFSLDSRSGLLRLAGHEPSQGEFPRALALDSSGRFLIAANERGNSLVSFHVEPATGRLVSTGHSAKIEAPAALCIL